MNMPVKAANIHSSDVFYRAAKLYTGYRWKKQLYLLEMEAFALFSNLHQYLNKMAATILTISDDPYWWVYVPRISMVFSLDNMFRLALESVVAMHESMEEI